MFILHVGLPSSRYVQITKIHVGKSRGKDYSFEEMNYYWQRLIESAFEILFHLSTKHVHQQHKCGQKF